MTHNTSCNTGNNECNLLKGKFKLEMKLNFYIVKGRQKGKWFAGFGIRQV